MQVTVSNARAALLLFAVSSVAAMAQNHYASQVRMMFADGLPITASAFPEAPPEGGGLFVNASSFGGSDIGARVNSAIASMPTVTQNGQAWTQGVVIIAAGNYTFSTTMNLNSPYLDLKCEQGAILTYTGSGDAIRILPSAQITGVVTTQPNQGPSVENCSIYAQSATAVSGIHAGDVAKIHLTNVAVNNFTGTPTSAGYWFDNTASFTEGLALTDISSTNNSIGMRFTNTGGTSSFGYTSIRGFRAEIRTNQIGFSVESGTFLYHSFMEAIAETSDSTGIVMSVSGTGIVGGNQGDDSLFIRGECVNSTGSCTGATLLQLGAQTQFVANGFMNALGTTMTTSIASGAILTWNGTTELNSTGYTIGWSGDNSVRMRFNSNTDLSFFNNKMSLINGYVVGWSSNPTSQGNFVGLSPCTTSTTATLCVGNGTTRDASAALTAGQFLGNPVSPTAVAGSGAGVSPSGVSLTAASTSVSGSVLFTTGTAPEALATLVTVTFATLLGQAPNMCIPTAQNAATAAALNNIFISSPTVSGFAISSGAGPLAASTAYQIGYACF